MDILFETPRDALATLFTLGETEEPKRNHPFCRPSWTYVLPKPRESLGDLTNLPATAKAMGTGWPTFGRMPTQYCGCGRTESISHHLETMGNHCLLVFTNIIPGFLSWCRISSIHGIAIELVIGLLAIWRTGHPRIHRRPTSKQTF